MNLKVEVIEKRLSEVLPARPEVICVYLFGSFLTMPEEARDIDLALLLEPGQDTATAFMRLYPLVADVFTPREVDLVFLRQASLSLRFAVISTGRVVYCRDEERRTGFEDITVRDYLDFKYHLEAAQQELFTAIQEGYRFA
ncbi:MAG: nucleotidyltransferase domain-containing protein [Clostridia bacterium]|nr:MAG: nucleotidyltransferase domain-containing protein [Clostridia bacterium]